MLNFFKDFLTYTKGERNGIIILVFVIFLFMLIPKILPYVIEQKQYDFSRFIQDIEDFEQQLNQGEELIAEQPEPEKEVVYEVFEFNPNDLPREQWLKLGIKERTIQVIKNYESKGGKFYDKSDLKKIYGFREDDYIRLEPYIKIPARKKLDYHHPENKKFDKVDVLPKRSNYENYIVEINTADSIVLKGLRGIGSVLANRIIGYRELIGGFVNKQQLLEVYGIDSILFASIERHIILDTSFVSKLNINELSKQELSSHPYLNYNIANSIVSYREQHGKFRNIPDLLDIYVIDEALLEKIHPYLLVE